MDIPLYRAVSHGLFAVDRNRAIALSSELNRPIELDAFTAQLLTLCEGVKSLEAHVDTVARGNPGVDRRVIRVTLDRLVAAEVLKTVNPRTVACENQRGQRPGITTVGVITADRPRVLERCVRSLVRHFNTHDRHPRIVVIDGSRDHTNREENRSTISKIAKSDGCQIQHVGPSEAAGLRSRLRSTGVDDRFLQFALRPGSVGCNRNLLLLLTRGEDLLSVDDDVICETWAMPGRQDGLALGDHSDPREWRFFGSRRDALNATAPAASDLLRAHEDLLGRELVSLLNESSACLDMEHACRHLTALLTGQAAAIVRATFAGIAGDSGVHCPYRLLFSGCETARRLMASPELFVLATSSREVVRAPARNTVTHDPLYMAGCAGLANRALLPPFIPRGRNEDGLFGGMLAFVAPLSLFGHLNHGVLHDPDKRRFYPRRFVSASQVRLADLLLAMMRRGCVTPSATPAVRLGRLGAFFLELAVLDPQDFLTYAKESLLEARSREFVAATQAAAAEPARSAHWHCALDAYRNSFVEALGRREFGLPIEFMRAESLDQGVRRSQLFLRRFGGLLEAWPTLWEAASSAIDSQDVLAPRKRTGASPQK